MTRKYYLPNMVQAITVLTVLKMLTNGEFSPISFFFHFRSTIPLSVVSLHEFAPQVYEEELPLKEAHEVRRMTSSITLVISKHRVDRAKFPISCYRNDPRLLR